ncbi:hypothetical protein C789_3033 [Microcystis aeruginosa FACHB-905 = DIANCHI905]|nr:hypothetical protein C789_3033 [Microcystis aeruginosa FACHB-905 = DIANCHI905]
MYKVRGLVACFTKQIQDFKASVSKTLHLDQRSPLLFHQTLIIFYYLSIGVIFP